MEPVENVLGARRHVRRQVADGVAAVGQERDVLVQLQALFAQYLVQTPFRLVVEALDETEVAAVAVLGDGLPDHDLEIRAVGRSIGLAGADIGRAAALVGERMATSEGEPATALARAKDGVRWGDMQAHAGLPGGLNELIVLDNSLLWQPLFRKEYCEFLCQCLNVRARGTLFRWCLRGKGTV